MSTGPCTCGLCTGLSALTPESNQPGQPAISYRIGSYSTFFSRMLSQIASPNTLADPPAGSWNIADLTTRSTDDPTIAILDAWSVILDVLTFYQERIANEGFLRTSTEHRSILELARAIGYELNPGVAAGTYLSFIIEDRLGAPSVAPLPTGPKTPTAPTQGNNTYNAGIVTLPPGMQVVSVPPQGQTSQAFETAAELEARTQWNLMLPRLTRPADFAFDSSGNFYLLGVRAGFAASTTVVDVDASQLYLLNPDTVSPFAPNPHTPLPPGPVACMKVSQLYFAGTGTGIAKGDVLLLLGKNPAGTVAFQTMTVYSVSVDNTNQMTLVEFSQNPATITFTPAQFQSLSVPSSPVPFSFATVQQYVLNTTAEDSDIEALMQIGGWNPGELATVANYVAPPTVTNQGGFSFGNEAAFFGHNAPQWKNLTRPNTALRGDAYPANWDLAEGGRGRTIWTDSQGNIYADASAYLERNFAGILPESWILVEPRGGTPLPLQVTAVADKSLADFSLTGKSTGLSLQSATGQAIQSPGSPALVHYFGQDYIFVSDSTGSLYFQVDNFGTWNGYEVVTANNNFSHTPALVSWAGGFYFFFFVVGTDGMLYYSPGSEVLSGSFTLVKQSPPLTGTPSVLIDAPNQQGTDTNQFDVFVHGVDGNLYHFWNYEGSWYGPEQHAAPGNVKFLNSPAATQGGPTAIEVFMIGSDGAYYHCGWSRGAPWWGPLLVGNAPPAIPLSFGVSLLGSAAATANAKDANNLDIFAIGSDGNLYHAWYYGGTWVNTESLGGGVLAGNPFLLANGPSSLEIFAIGSDGYLYHKNYIGKTWFGFSSLGGGNLVGSPWAVAPTPTTISVVATGSDGNMYRFQWNGTVWSGPELVPGGYLPSIYTRKSKVHIQSTQQTLAEIPVTDDIEAGTTYLMLNGLVTGLTAGQAIAVTGNRSDAPAQSQSEVVLLVGAQHVGGYTQLEFEPPGLVYSYARSSMTLNANTVAATHGATIAVPEVLGSGSAAEINQSFTLSRSPVTYVPAATAEGSQSSIQIQVNNIIWQQKPSLFGLTPNDRAYIARQHDNGSTTVIFGDGAAGALLPTGQNNITARYRVGIGAAGNLPAGSISVLQSRPPGLRTVNNPVPASGGADPETLDGAREHAPRTVLTIDRIVSLSDYEDFAAAFAGIGQAQAQSLLVGTQIIVQITVAGVEGASVDVNTPLALSLSAAIDAARDPLPVVNVSSYQPILFNITATILIDETDYVAAAVHAQVVSTITTYFAFDNRSLAQPVTAAEIVATIQAVPGVVAVDLYQLYRGDDPTGPSQTSPKPYLPANFASVNNSGDILPAEMLLLNPVGLSLTDKKS